jgi:two-component system, cell cycle sensor histidine kinase and response regulator CckA
VLKEENSAQSPHERPRPGSYGLGLLFYFVAAVITVTFWDLLFKDVPFALFFAAVAATTWTGGLRTGILVAVCGAATTAVLMSTAQHIVFASPRALLAVAVFICYLVDDRLRYATMLAQANSTLRSERGRLQAVVHQLPVGVIMAAADSGELLLANKKVEEIFRHPFIPASRIEEYSQYHGFHVDGRPYAPEDYPLARSVRDGEEVFNEEIEYVCGDGAHRILQVSSAPILDSDGKRSAALVVFADITERKHLDQQLMQSLRMEAIGRLAGGVAHDFNNLLTVILGYSDLALSGINHDHPLRAPIDQIHTCGLRAADLTKQLLAFSRRQVLQPKTINVNSVIRDLQTMLRRLIPENVEILTDLDASLGNVQADPGQLEQIIVNLAVNARDAMPQGGRLTMGTSNSHLDDQYVREHLEVTPGEYVMLAVTDSGMGMDAETQARIFEPFFSTKEPGKGTGLGLATVYGIVKQSGGQCR